MLIARRILASHTLSLDCRQPATSSLCFLMERGSSLIPQVGNAISRLRRAAHLSQEELAARRGLHRTYSGTLERGEKTMTITTAHKVARAVGLSLAEFFAQIEIDLPGNRPRESA